MRSLYGVRAALATSLTFAIMTGFAVADSADDLTRLQGTWKMVDDHWGGKPHNDLVAYWDIKGETLTSTSATASRGEFTLDTTKTPGRFEKTNFDRTTTKIKGTFSVEGDTLRIYRPLLRAEPPLDLPAEPARGYELEVWKRVGEKGSTGIDGMWKKAAWLISGNRNIKSGEQVMVVKGNVYAVVSESRSRCSIKIDASKNPKHFDLTFEDGLPLLGKHTEPWVYRLDGDRLTVWQSLGGRPAEVSDAADSKSHFQVFERAKP